MKFNIDFSKLDRNPWVIERIVVNYNFLFNISIILLYVLYDEVNENKFLVISIFRVIYILILKLINWSRKSNKFFIPFLHEMSDKNFWRIGFWVFMLTKSPFLRHYDGLPYAKWSKIGHYLIDPIVITILLILYLRYFWGDKTENYSARVKKLRRKANLYKSEVAAMLPTILDIAEKKEQTPVSWKIVDFVLSIMIAANFSQYAKALLQYIF